MQRGTYLLGCWSFGTPVFTSIHAHRGGIFLLIIHVTLGGTEAQIECSAPLNPSLYHSLIIHVYYRPSELLICQDNENMLIRELP